MKRILLISLILAAMLLSACGVPGTAPPTEAPPTSPPAEQPMPPKKPEPTPTPTPTPTPPPASAPAPKPALVPLPPSFVSDGSVVKVHYTGTLEDGTVFDTSVGREPLEFTMGTGAMIPGFENAVRSMKLGQKKTVTIPSDEAYGPHRDDMVLVIERDKIPEDLNPEVGQQLQMQNSGGRTVLVMVTEVSGTTITIDANHAFAGKDLTFEIELVEIS
ncbi:FKBP-type peptidyl-prolyl cis-trans isomerase [Chloroflexota bacterium]